MTGRDMTRRAAAGRDLAGRALPGRAPGGWELPISERELNLLTREMDEAHHATLPVMRAAAVVLAEEIGARLAGGPAADAG